MFPMMFKICFRHLVLLEMIYFEKIFKTVAQKFAIQWNPDLTICQGSSEIISLYRDSRLNDTAVK